MTGDRAREKEEKGLSREFILIGIDAIYEKNCGSLKLMFWKNICVIGSEYMF